MKELAVLGYRLLWLVLSLWRRTLVKGRILELVVWLLRTICQGFIYPTLTHQFFLWNSGSYEYPCMRILFFFLIQNTVSNISLPLKLVSGRVGISISLMSCFGRDQSMSRMENVWVGYGYPKSCTIILWVYNGYMLP